MARDFRNSPENLTDAVLIGALDIDLNVTDTFNVTVVDAWIVAVTNSSNDPRAYWDAEAWIRANRPGLIEVPCEGFFNGGPTSVDCVRAMVRGYAEYASVAGLSHRVDAPE